MNKSYNILTFCTGCNETVHYIFHILTKEKKILNLKVNFPCFLLFHRYASLYFCVAIEKDDNELLTLEIIHRYVELLDKYFGSVSTGTNLIWDWPKSIFDSLFAIFERKLTLCIVLPGNFISWRYVSWISFSISRKLILCWTNWFSEERFKKQARKMSWKQFQPKISFRRYVDIFLCYENNHTKLWCQNLLHCFEQKHCLFRIETPSHDLF